jgi:hypothetical protein
MKRIAVLILAVASLGVVASGCGGGGGGGSTSKADYMKQMQALGQDLSSSFTNLSNAKPTDIKSSAALFNEVADALDTAGDKLDGIEPPSDAADAHQKLLDGAHQAADDFRGLAKQLENAKLSELPQLMSRLNPSKLAGLKKMQQAVTELKAKGYDLGSLSS